MFASQDRGTRINYKTLRQKSVSMDADKKRNPCVRGLHSSKYRGMQMMNIFASRDFF